MAYPKKAALVHAIRHISTIVITIYNNYRCHLMGINTNFKGKLHISRKVLLVVFVSLLLVLLAILGTFYMLTDSNNDEGPSFESNDVLPVLEGAMYVKNEGELRSAIDNAVDGSSVVIAFMEDIYLVDSALSIPANVNITLASDSKYGVCKIFGAVGSSTIVVENGGILTIEGIVVTHESSSSAGSGIVVNSGGIVNMHSGAILGNTAVKNGGGVANSGTFIMHSGKISGNTAGNNGGGIFNMGVFEMYGGEITNNTAINGGGVFNRGASNRMGGIITDNKATTRGYNWA